MNSIHNGKFDLNLLVVFDAIYRTGSITRAAQSLHLSQSAVSHALNRLRDIVEDPLFIKVPKGVVPSDYAHRIAPSLQFSLESLSTVLVNEKDFDPASASSTVTIGVSQMDQLLFLAPLFKKMGSQAPGMNLRVHPVLPELFLDALDKKHVDMLCVIQSLSSLDLPNRIRKTCLFEDDLVCVMSARHPLAEKALTIDGYVSTPHLIMATGHVEKTWIDDLLTAKGLKRRVGLVAPHPSAVAHVVPQSDLVCTLARSIALPYVNHPDFYVTAAPFSWNEPHEGLLMWHGRSDNDPAQRWARKLIEEVWQESYQPA
ncbi:LysR family transcriptional regulator [Alteromonas sp. 1_MG-2023]|uniref:LysR family transcriptional regulator n=1 Tax=Alteromonas sp. 1_MG-2023 TaxID=3062669 RepID=UPI0026E28976|nr:LysR family transcriptional regulator [Alteromonas sp. 1_MG-2023]MDO6475153.1 LysR family transcriptional regulator [Alteromonas sp. 1_MG-2023]